MTILQKNNPKGKKHQFSNEIYCSSAVYSSFPKNITHLEVKKMFYKYRRYNESMKAATYNQGLYLDPNHIEVKYFLFIEEGGGSFHQCLCFVHPFIKHVCVCVCIETLGICHD